MANSFNSGNYSSSTKDSNGFWLTCSIAVTSDVANNRSLLSSISYTLNHTSAGMFDTWTTTRSLSAYYDIDGGTLQSAAIQAVTTSQLSMPSTTLTLASGLSIYIPHDSDGNQLVTITGYCDGAGSESFIPNATQASINITLPKIPRGQRFYNTNQTTYINTYKRFNGTDWTDITTRKRFNGTDWIDV